MTIEAEILERLDRIEAALLDRKPDLITGRQAKEILNISSKTLYKYQNIWPLIDKTAKGVEKYKAKEIYKLKKYLGK